MGWSSFLFNAIIIPPFLCKFEITKTKYTYEIIRSITPVHYF